MMQHEYSKTFLLGPKAASKAAELAKQESSKAIFSVTFRDGSTLDIWEFLDKYYVIQMDSRHDIYSFEEVTKDYADNMEVMLRGTNVLFGGF